MIRRTEKKSEMKRIFDNDLLGYFYKVLRKRYLFFTDLCIRGFGNGVGKYNLILYITL